MTPENNTVKNQFRTLFTSAIHLKEKFDLNDSIDVIQYTFELFLKDLEYLKKLLPKEIIEQGYLLRHVLWIEKRLNQEKPEQCYSDICNICYTDIYVVQDAYLKSISPAEEPVSNEIGIITKQLKLLDESDCDPVSWLYTTERLLKGIFPLDNINLTKQRGARFDFAFTTSERVRFKNILNGYIQEIELRNKNLLPVDKWTQIHPLIAKVSKSRFETDHYSDAVEASLKELNDFIKKAYHKKTGKEEDGDSLMRRAFTPKEPVFLLADISNESGRNVQQGYMEIFAGAMKGIRNPKTHANLIIDSDEAWEKIILASHLMRMWDKHNKE